MQADLFPNSKLHQIKKYIFASALGIAGLAFLIYGAVITFSKPTPKIAFEPASHAEKTTPTQIPPLFIDIEGSVQKPGLYELHSQDRLQDALIAAGGLSEHADTQWVTKNLNLAMKLHDGFKIYIPRMGEDVSGITSTTSTTGITGESRTIINMNTASESQLDSLSGVGPVTAQKIITNRPYQTIDELVSKKSVSKSVFEKIKTHITIE